VPFDNLMAFSSIEADVLCFLEIKWDKKVTINALNVQKK